MNSLFTLGLVIGMTVTDTTLGTTVANLGMTNTTFPAPVFFGDTGPDPHDGGEQARQLAAVPARASSISNTRASTRRAWWSASVSGLP